ncbi:hypothetical protein SUGI_0971540 [Cryptomeria japonica]|uniref:coniferin beta-glucosidase isoform X2 n=1 Tax=Cryptomeria japonica TaxID=3369 RepID=UPI002414AC7C|nr:coniferin beta-glucosidase isoform X2 [Cryptomeria japonica]GLJ46120.1 hypothetical protein SUGI_0971540 [Cryptomeria japonica]
MGIEKIIYGLVLISCSLYATAEDDGEFSRKAFPSNFIFGVGSSAYQYEGGYVEDGKGLSNWDVFAHIPGKIADGKNGDIAVDEYHRYKEDVEIMWKMGVEMYRFSIAWSRIFPKGDGKINPLGVKYYNNLINELLSKGIQPFVTLCHYDIPQALEEQYGSLLNPRFIDDFAQYAEACFRMFGDRVKYWTTFNEPNTFVFKEYDTGDYPPNRCSHPFGSCSAGNSSTEPYIAMHNVLRAHAATVDIYRREYQTRQGGFIGIVISAAWFEPLRNIPKDLEASERIITFHNSWILDPLAFGEYPAIMRKLVGKRLPSITEDLHNQLQGSFDFIGLNYYGSRYATDASEFLNSPNRDFYQDSLTTVTNVKDGIPIGPQMYPPDMYGVPFGIEKVVDYIKTRYSNPPIFITENGFGDQRNDNLPFLQMLNDTFRVDYIEETLKYLAKAVRKGADVRGYLVWSLLDNFEWIYGYTSKFGMYHVNYTNGLQRYPKFSAHWYGEFLKGKSTLHKEEFLREFMESYAGKAIPTIAEV